MSADVALRAQGGRSGRALLPPQQSAPAAARRLVSTLMLAWGVVEQIEIIELITSELVSNAVLYAGDYGDIEIELAADQTCIYLSVSDGWSQAPKLPTPGAPGLGLSLVDRVASRWGVEEYVLGKRVWVELDRKP